MNPVKYRNITLTGETGKLLNNICNRWLIGIAETNPAILTMLRDRDLRPYRDLLPWSGEFAGKYLTGAYYVYRLTGSRELYDYVNGFIGSLLKYQDADGYIGCFSRSCRLTGAYSQDPSRTGLTWDSWSHYHIMYGLLLWYDITGNESLFAAVEKAARLFMNRFYDGKPTIVSTGWSEMNLAVYHIFGILYRRTKKTEYLYFASKIEGDLSDEAAGDYINYSLKGYEYYQCAKPRWESMHIIMGISEMYRNTGNRKYLDVASQIFYSILKTDVHNTGAFSTDEQAIGNPFKNSAIETCCVVAYNALGIEIYSLTGDIRIADFLERSHYNAVLGYNSPSGRWSTYNTPMEGTKCANYHSINFQCRPGSPDLNCCSVNAPRGVASVYDWMITESDGTLCISFYEDMHAETADGLEIDISGGYPASGRVTVRVNSHGSAKKIAFRIPGWSANTVITSGGETFRPAAGKYFAIKKVWESEITIDFDMTPYTEEGGGDYSGKCSIYSGPVLFAFDCGENPGFDPENIPAISREELVSLLPVLNPDGILSLETGCGVRLTDFYHAGVSGAAYKTWLRVDD